MPTSSISAGSTRIASADRLVFPRSNRMRLSSLSTLNPRPGRRSRPFRATPAVPCCLPSARRGAPEHQQSRREARRDLRFSGRALPFLATDIWSDKMGGYGSSRPGFGYPKAEHMKRLDIAHLKRRGYLRGGPYRYSWTWGGCHSPSDLCVLYISLSPVGSRSIVMLPMGSCH
jgi:hypothetical protein